MWTCTYTPVFRKNITASVVSAEVHCYEDPNDFHPLHSYIFKEDEIGRTCYTYGAG